jgi:hypothetical protein
LGYSRDAQACELIREATELGDRFRSLVGEKLAAAGVPRLVGCPRYHEILREADREVYG